MDIREVAVAYDGSAGVCCLQSLEQPQQCLFLSGGACIGMLALGVYAALIADT